MGIPFNRPYLAGSERDYIERVLGSRRLSGDGELTRRCEEILESTIGAHRALLTPSCTDALEMAAILAGVGPGDEVIMPSFTFSSTANAFALRGATPVFVDIEERTQNLDVGLAEQAITDRTRAIVPIHYAGVSCDMDALRALADAAGVMIIEDAAQAVSAAYRGRPLGSLGELATLSFHETKNLVSGEGGALLINDASLTERAEIVREKGTNRAQFYRGETDKYTWQEIGSSFLPSELTAAFLLAQLEAAEEIRRRRLEIWELYHRHLEALETRGLLVRPVIPEYAEHNGHMYYVLLADENVRQALIRSLAEREIAAVFHYVPLHSAPAGRRYGRSSGELPVTDRISARLLRLPLWVGMTEREVETVARAIEAALT